MIDRQFSAHRNQCRIVIYIPDRGSVVTTARSHRNVTWNCHQNRPHLRELIHI